MANTTIYYIAPADGVTIFYDWPTEDDKFGTCSQNCHCVSGCNNTGNSYCTCNNGCDGYYYVNCPANTCPTDTCPADTCPTDTCPTDTCPANVSCPEDTSTGYPKSGRATRQVGLWSNFGGGDYQGGVMEGDNVTVVEENNGYYYIINNTNGASGWGAYDPLS